MIQLNPTIDVSTPLGDCEAMFIIDYGVNTNTVWVCRMPGGSVKHFYSDDIKIYGNPMNGKGWDVDSELDELDRKSHENIKKIMESTVGKEIMVNPEYAQLFTPKFEGPIERFDNNEELNKEHQKYNIEAWVKILLKWFGKKWLSDFAYWVDLFYEPPKNTLLKNWTDVYNWHKSLAHYKGTTFLDFLIKFYPAPDLKKQK